MKKFDPIDIFFIIIISGYFITLGLFLIALLFTLIKKNLRQRKLTQAESLEINTASATPKPVLNPSNIYVTIYNSLLKGKYIPLYWNKLVEYPKELKPNYKTKLIKLPKIPKVNITYNQAFKNLKAPEIEEVKSPKLIKEQLISKFAKKPKDNNKLPFQDIINKLFKTKKKATPKPVKKTKKVKENKPKKEFKLENIALFRKLFMKPIPKVLDNSEEKAEVKVSEIKKEQLNIFNCFQESEEPIKEISPELANVEYQSKENINNEIIQEVKITKIENIIEQKPETKLEKKDINKSPKEQQHNNKKEKNNKDTSKKNSKTNNSQTNKKTNQNVQSSSNSNKKKNNANKRANGTAPKKKQNNKKSNYKKKNNNTSKKKSVT